MRHTGSLLVFCLLAFGLHSQRVQVTYGTHLYQHSLLDQLNTLRKPEFGNPIQCVTASMMGLTGEREYDVTERVTWSKYLPQAMRINDSVSGKISGWSAGMDMGKDLFQASHKTDLVFMLGFSTGRMKLVQQGQEQFEKTANVLHLTNGFFCPRGTIVFNGSIRQFSFTLGAQYSFDVSSTRWKEKLFALHKPESVEVPGFRQTHFEVFAGIGWNFWREDEKERAPSYWD